MNQTANPNLRVVTISNNSIVAATKSQVSCALNAETVILHFDVGVYFGLNGGIFVWEQIQHARTVRELRDAILREFEVGPDRCEQDLLNLVEELQNQDLIEVRDNATQP